MLCLMGNQDFGCAKLDGVKGVQMNAI